MLSRRDRRLAAGTALLAVLIGGAAVVDQYCQERGKVRARAEAITGGSIARGEAAFGRYGCGGCHSIGGVPQATGMVGPPLSGVGKRVYIAGKLSNTPDNLIRWIEHPQSVSPGTAMPEIGVKERDARDLAAFLYSRS